MDVSIAYVLLVLLLSLVLTLARIRMGGFYGFGTCCYIQNLA